MYHKIVWCYIIVLTLLDISLNTKLSAQGKSHGNGVSVHESLIEEISLQEWGEEAEGEVPAGAEAPGRRVVSLSPRVLAFGRRALVEAHALTVTVTNTANETIHLASVAGTTPDFHASFFESKTLACGANTTFSVVYLGRREGPVAAHLYIHTSKGVHKYPVSAVGAASPWRVWPLVALRVPANATLEPLLTLYNPTDTTVQVSEVYSSGAWLGLALPDGAEEAPRAMWALPPHATRALVRLRVRDPRDRAPLHAYIRIKGNMTGGGLVVGVEAAAVPAGEFLSPLQIRLRTRGSRDASDTMFVSAGSSAGADGAGGAGLHARVSGGCGRRAPPEEPPPGYAHTHNGGRSGSDADAGVDVRLVRAHIDPHQELTRTAQLTFDYAKMWAGYEASLANGSGRANGGGGGGEGEGPEGGAYCAGWVQVGRASLPYSLRMLPGTLALQPSELHVVRCNREEAAKSREVVAHNRFPEAIRIMHVDFPKEVRDSFHTESLAPLELGAGAAGAVCRVRLREGAGAGAGGLRADLTLRTNLSDYTLPLLLYEGTFTFEWEWPHSADGALRVGGVGAGLTRVVRARLHNPGPAPLCITRLSAHLPPPAAAALHLYDERTSCVPGGGWVRARLEVHAGAALGRAQGAVHVHTRHGRASADVHLHVHAGTLHARALLLPPAAPYVSSVGPLELQNSMSVRMRVIDVTQPPHSEDPAVQYIAEGEGAVRAGAGAAGRVQYSPERHCEPHCYTGLPLDTPEGAEWAGRGRDADATLALQRDAELQRARYALYTPKRVNFTLHLHTTEVVQVEVEGSVSWTWPSVRGGAGAGVARAGLAGVGATLPLRVRACNPSRTRTLLLQPRLAVHPLLLGGEEGAEAAEPACVDCVWSERSFSLAGWRATRGAAHSHSHNHSEYLLLQPRAEVELTITFAPAQPRDLAAYLYLRNNLTVVERVLVTGRGALPAFELGGRKPNSSDPILFEVLECGEAGWAGVARRGVAVRNTGRVALRLRDWRVAGRSCAAGGFRLQPCAQLRLQPAETKELQLQFAADWTRSRAQATLSVVVGDAVARFTLAGLAPARLVAACGAGAWAAPAEPALRWAGAALALLALLAAAALGAADAERALRAHRAARLHAPAPRAPLDLRALAAAPPLLIREIPPARGRGGRLLGLRVVLALVPGAARPAGRGLAVRPARARRARPRRRGRAAPHLERAPCARVAVGAQVGGGSRRRGGRGRGGGARSLRRPRARALPQGARRGAAPRLPAVRALRAARPLPAGHAPAAEPRPRALGPRRQLERCRVAREHLATERRRVRERGAAGPHRVGRPAAARLALPLLLRRRARLAPRPGAARDPRVPRLAARSVPADAARGPRAADVERRRERRPRVPVPGVSLGLVRGTADARRGVAVGRRPRGRRPARRGGAAPARLPRAASASPLRPLPVAGLDLDSRGAGLAPRGPRRDAPAARAAHAASRRRQQLVRPTAPHPRPPPARPPSPLPTRLV